MFKWFPEKTHCCPVLSPDIWILVILVQAMMACCLLTPSHYLNQCCPGDVRNMSMKLIQNVKIVFQENIYQCVICKMWSICFWLQYVNSVWPSDTIWWYRSGSTLSLVMACCLTTPSHYLNQCCLIINETLWYLAEGKFTETCCRCNSVQRVWKLNISKSWYII